MGKGSGRRPKNISDEELEKAWNSIFAGHPNEDQFEDCIKKQPPVVKEDNYGNELPYKIETPELKKFKDDPDRFYDETGDA
jgi:hypothetical protein